MFGRRIVEHRGYLLVCANLAAINGDRFGPASRARLF